MMAPMHKKIAQCLLPNMIKSGLIRHFESWRVAGFAQLMYSSLFLNYVKSLRVTARMANRQDERSKTQH